VPQTVRLYKYATPAGVERCRKRSLSTNMPPRQGWSVAANGPSLQISHPCRGGRINSAHLLQSWFFFHPPRNRGPSSALIQPTSGQSSLFEPTHNIGRPTAPALRNAQAASIPIAVSESKTEIESRLFQTRIASTSRAPRLQTK